MDYGLSYDGDHDFTLSGYTDADWARSVADKKKALPDVVSVWDQL
jgi:hypothetical protein